MAEPLTREERETLLRWATTPENAEVWKVETADVLRWEVTVQAVEDLAEHRLKALDGMHADLLKVQAEREAIAAQRDEITRICSLTQRKLNTAKAALKHYQDERADVIAERDALARRVEALRDGILRVNAAGFDSQRRDIAVEVLAADDEAAR